MENVIGVVRRQKVVESLYGDSGLPQNAGPPPMS